MPRPGPLVVAGAGLGAAALLYMLSQDNVPISDRLRFVNAFGPIDLEISAREGWLPGILTGWAAMESAWGTSELARLPPPAGGFNVFGVKAGDTWKGLGRPYVTKVTKEHQGTPQETTTTATFRVYPNWKASAEDLVHLLKIESVYKGALDALNRKDVAGFLRAIEASGYSTASKYGDRILNATRAVAAVA